MSVSRETAISFRCAEEDLIGIIHRPENASMRALGVLIVVGGPQYRVGSHRQFVLMARALAEAGFPVFRFDYRGMGDATGSQRTFEDVDDDIRAAIAAFREALPTTTPIVALGLCDAASAALMYCGRYSDVVGLILLNPWVRTEQSSAKVIVRHYYFERLFQRTLWEKIRARQFSLWTFLKDIFLLARSAWGSRGMGSERNTQPFLKRMETGLRTFNGPILVLLSGRDLTAKEFEDFASRSTLWAKRSRTSQVTTLRSAEADHTFSAAASLKAACDNISAWLRTAERAYLQTTRSAHDSNPLL